MTLKQGRLPPGPAEKYDPSEDLLRWMNDQFNRFGSIFRASVYGTDVYVVSDPEHVDHVLRRNWQNYKKGQAIKRIGFLLGNGLMVSEGEFWKSQRRMIQPAFHDKAIGAVINVILAANTALLQKWKDAARAKESVNITSDISHMVLKVLLICIFGDDYEQVAPHFNILSDESARNLQFAQRFRPLGKIVSQVAGQRRKQNRTATDMLGMLMKARDRRNQAMPDSQLVCEVMTLIVAGHETTASTLNWVWHLLSKSAEAEEKLWSELNAIPASGSPEIGDLAKFVYTRQVIEETLRLYPAGWLMTRVALKDDRLGDYLVPARTEIYISPYLIQRHPAFWEAPDRFNPDRFRPDELRTRRPMTTLPFSAGPRKCIGESFARIEMQIHLMTIAKHLRLRGTSEQSIQLEAGVNLRNRHDFIMTPQMIGS
ncbi:MAG TPA: cytochrome P450 [Tepidisphaeraceae bacterium]|nr:cytochrome P450 [Tepidisphaeraceae bacterium]